VIPVLYPANETAFTTNGLGGLPDAISCVVTEQHNTPGGYWLEMEYPIDGLHYADIAPDRIIYAAPSMGNRPQPFRISRITRPINGIVHIEAPHLCAELQKITSYGVDTGTNIQGMMFNQIYRARQLGQTVPFWCTTDITVESSVTFSHPEPTTLMDILLGTEGSVLDVVGGEFEWNGYNIILHRQRGVDSGLEIRYGVNMSDINAETDATELVTAVIPFWKGNVNDTETVVIGSMCTASNASAFAYVRCVPLDVTQEFQQMEQGQQPTAAQVTAKGQAFIDSTSQSELSMSINVKYTPTTLGIGDRRINLCDTVRVVHPDLHLSSTAKVVETKYNTLVEQYDELTIGSIRKNIVDTIADIIKK
jgi:phage minor structural protein